MPELPEVETIRRQLDDVLPGRTVIGLTAMWPKTLSSRGMELDEVPGLTITGVSRRGKVLLVDLDHTVTVLIHLRMTGQLLFDEGDHRPGALTRAVITLDRGSMVFNDQRKFGRIVATPTSLVDADPLLARMGPEPLDPGFSPTRLGAQLSRHRTLGIKAALLDQSTLAGIGNIYADEVLFHAGIHPTTPCTSLDTDEIERLFDAVVTVLATAIAAGGSTMRDYRDATGAAGSYLDHALVFGRTTQPCRRCGTAIIKINVAGRGTHLCMVCQPAGTRRSD